MDRTRHQSRPLARGSQRLAAALLVALPLLLLSAGPAAAVDPPPGLVIEARALVGSHVRLGAWTTVEVGITNGGPAITGELRLAGDRQGRSTYGTEVDLPTGSDKSYFLYAQPSIFRSKIEVLLISGQATVATLSVPITSHDPYETMVAVVAERPQALVPDLTAAAAANRGPRQTILTLRPEDLPPRVEAWSSIDRLVWQDVDAALLSPEQRSALAGWVAAGGRLVVLGGSTGIGAANGFPEDLLPYQPSATVDVPLGDLTPLLGSALAASGDLPAWTGAVDHGSTLLAVDGKVVAAEAPFGRGEVSLIGFDPGDERLAGTTQARSLWRRLVPIGSGQAGNPLSLPDDSGLVGALGNIPAVALPAIGPLLFVLVAYIVTVGPLNYLVLKRLDRREWAWVTIPAAVVAFAAASYGLGALMKGSEVIVNQIGIVRAGGGTDQGMAQVYVGVFSPSRQRYDVRVKGGALLSNPISSQQAGAFEQPLDVLFGETSRLRGYQVGFGALRGFRAEGAVKAPVVDAELRFEDGRLVGHVENRSAEPLEGVALVFGDAVANLEGLAAGESRDVDLKVSAQGAFGMPLSERLYGPSFSGGDADSERGRYTRRMVLDQLTGYEGKVSATKLGGDGAVVLAWRAAPALEIELAGQTSKSIGQTLYIVPFPVEIDGAAAFPPSLVRQTVLESDAADAGDVGGGFSLSRGTMTTDFRPVAFRGEFEVTKLALSLTQGDFRDLQPGGEPVGPLPEDQQPPQDDPLDTDAEASGGIQQPRFDGLPEIQLWDRVEGRWMEFAHFPQSGAVAIAQPERYVDSTGSLLVRFVNRSLQEGVYFQLRVSMEGTIR
jgi:hypothetical protein